MKQKPASEALKMCTVTCEGNAHGTILHLFCNPESTDEFYLLWDYYDRWQPPNGASHSGLSAQRASVEPVDLEHLCHISDTNTINKVLIITTF